MKNFDNIKNIVNIVFLMFFFPVFIGGVAVTNYFFFIFILYFIIFYLKEIVLVINEHYKIFCSFILFYLFLLISSLISDDITHSLKTSLLYFLYSVYISCLIVLFQIKKDYIKYFLFFGIITF